jgi:hypothetical protein
MQGLKIGLFVIDMGVRFENSKTVVIIVSTIVYYSSLNKKEYVQSQSSFLRV